MFSAKSNLLLIALLSGAFFFSSVGQIWPLLETDLTPKRDELTARASAHLQANGVPTDRYQSATRLRVDEELLDYVERSFPPDFARMAEVAHHEIVFKQPDSATYYKVWIAGETVTGWKTFLQDDEPGDSLTLDSALSLLPPVAGTLKSTGWEDLEKRRDYHFEFEEIISDSPRLCAITSCIVSGGTLTSVNRTLILPAEGERENRVRKAPENTLASVGFVLVSVGLLIAFFVLLRGAATLRLKRSAALAIGVTLCLSAADVLNTFYFFENWDPLVPKAISYLETFFLEFAIELQIAAFLLICIAAGDVIDQKSGGHRGRTLWAFVTGRWREPGVAIASYRGFLVGLLCGGVLAGSVLVLHHFAGARVAFQPRGFFFYALNSASPTASLLLFFFFIACLEELGYRYFGGSWLEQKTGSRAVAIFLPALVYGLAHTSFDFLPPEEPFWARPIVMTLVGCVWGWAFLKYDALTVVLSHYTADLFIFSWPRMASGEAELIAASFFVMLVPLLPAIAALGKRNLATKGTKE